MDLSGVLINIITSITDKQKNPIGNVFLENWFKFLVMDTESGVLTEANKSGQEWVLEVNGDV